MAKKSARKQGPSSTRKGAKRPAPPTTKLGKVLRSAREARGFSVERAAQACGCSARRWNSLERGAASDPSLALALVIAKTLRISFYDIVRAL